MRPTTTYTMVQATRDMSIMFISATYAPFLKQIGLSNPQITIVNWSFAVLMLLSQVPTGVFADKFGRALSVKLGLLILFLGHFAYFFARGFWSALVIEGLVGVGFAFVRGADEAWLASWLNTKKDGSGKFEASFGTANTVGFTACLLSGSLGAIIGAKDLRLPWLACGFTGILSFALAVAFMREPPLQTPKSDADSGSSGSNPSSGDLANRSWRLLCGSYDLKWCVTAICVLAFVMPFFHYWPLVYRDHADAFGMAGLWFIVYGPKVVGAFAMRLWSKKLSNGKGILAVCAALASTGIGLFVAGRSLALGALLAGTLAMEFALGFFQPLVSAFVQKRVGEEYRATYGSLQALITGIWSTVVMIGIVGALALRPDNNASILRLWREMGLLMLVATVPILLFRPKGKKTEPVVQVAPATQDM